MPANRTVWLQNPANWAIGYWPNHNSEGGGRYFVENIAAGLDEENEWYYNATSRELLVLLAADADPNSTPVYVPQLDTVLRVNATTDISFANISIRHNNFVCNTTMVCDYQSTSWLPNAAVEIVNSSNVNFVQNEVCGRRKGGRIVAFLRDTSSLISPPSVVHQRRHLCRLDVRPEPASSDCGQQLFRPGRGRLPRGCG